MRLDTISAKLILMVAVVAAMGLPSLAKVIVNEGNGVNITMANDAIELNIAVEAGGRITRLINKTTGRDLVSIWTDGHSYGGLLDDRNVFTALTYRATVSRPDARTGQVRLSAQALNGMSMQKTLTLREGESTLWVTATFANGSQEEARCMVRNFLLPGEGPRTDADQYLLPFKDKPLQPMQAPNGWFGDLAAPWSALWDQEQGEGILIAAPGVDRFYFWQGSNEHPSYEWVYPNVPAGKAITFHYALHVVNDAAPDWPQVSAAVLKNLKPSRLADVPDWQNEQERYRITEAEQSRGFWLSTGNGSDKRRLPEPLRIDVPLNESRSVYVAFNALKDFSDADLQVRFENLPDGLVQAGWQVKGEGFVKVSPWSASAGVALANGAEGRLWLTLQGGAEPVDAQGELLISLAGQTVALPLHVKVWPVKVPATRPFDVRGYGGFGTMAGGYDITPETLRQTHALLDYFQAMGGNILDLSLAWGHVFRRVKIVGTDQSVHDWLRAHRESLPESVTDWPAIDFSYYDPWIEAAKARGVTSVTTYLSVKDPVSAAIEQWRLVQLKAYLEAHGMEGFICKIDDEMAPESIPDYIEQAKIAQQAGWRPCTTVTGLIARSAHHIAQLNPYVDRWVLQSMSTTIFDELIHQAYQTETRTLVMPAAKWRPYGNGGARNMVAQPLYGTLIPHASTEIEAVRVFQDGQPLESSGRSPYGNQQSGRYFAGTGNYLYISPRDGTNAENSQITVTYQVRVPAADGERLATLDPTDERWFYGGGSSPYAIPYERAATHPLKALEGGYDGYAWYGYYRWNVDKIVWYDNATGTVSVSPAYLGLKDGWSDARLLTWLADSKKAPISRFISEQPDAPLRVGPVRREVHEWNDIVNLTDPFMLNAVRRQMLETASASSPASDVVLQRKR